MKPQIREGKRKGGTPAPPISPAHRSHLHCLTPLHSTPQVQGVGGRTPTPRKNNLMPTASPSGKSKLIEISRVYRRWTNKIKPPDRGGFPAPPRFGTCTGRVLVHVPKTLGFGTCTGRARGTKKFWYMYRAGPGRKKLCEGCQISIFPKFLGTCTNFRGQYQKFRYMYQLLGAFTKVLGHVTPVRGWSAGGLVGMGGWVVG